MPQPPQDLVDPGSPAANTSSASAPLDAPFSGITEILGILPVTEAHDPLVGSTIGDVTLVGVLAEGGMGRVYEGRQRSPDRPVAVKVLRPGFITPEGIRRFAREAELLGSLRHPHIAQVHWAGACDIRGSAVPFIVMEFVPGALPITAYARDHGLDTAARVALFRKVCAAVARAHAAGIVHRDLKPGNVLVDASGEPKLIDFGIARIADAAADGGGTALTELGRLVGTVQYMSPEQIAGDAAAVDPRADVYALGLLLHELVSGRRPYDIDPRRVFDAARVIRERKPVSLAVADGRKPAPGLERVIENCLAHEPARRYPDAAAVATALDDDRGEEPSRFGLRVPVLAGLTVAALTAMAFFRPGFERPTPIVTAPPAVTSDPGAARFPARPTGSRPLTVEEVQSARAESGVLAFHNVSDIPPAVAEVLVGRGLRVRLQDLPAVSPELAAILGRSRGGVELHGIREIMPEIAARLTTMSGPLCLDGVESLDVATARVLAGYRDWLNLAGLREISPAVLAELTHHGGPGMTISVPGTLDLARAEIIARHRGVLYLLRVETVDVDAAKALAAHRGPVRITAERLTPEVDRLLAELQ